MTPKKLNVVLKSYKTYFYDSSNIHSFLISVFKVYVYVVLHLYTYKYLHFVEVLHLFFKKKIMVH